jgi:hypothetical protein
MHDQRNLTQDAVLRAQIAMANRLIAEQSATIARAHSAIERAMESLREPDGEGRGRPGRCATSGPTSWQQVFRCESASEGGGDRAAEYSAR